MSNLSLIEENTVSYHTDVRETNSYQVKPPNQRHLLRSLKSLWPLYENSQSSALIRVMFKILDNSPVLVSKRASVSH